VIVHFFFPSLQSV